MNLRRVLAWCVVAGAWVPLSAGCGGAQAVEGPAKPTVAAPVVETIDHEPCDPRGHKLETFDTRGDGKPVVTKVEDSSGHELCRITDINHDGKADLYEYFDANGALRRLEADYDANGTIDAIEVYEDGKLLKREYDTTGQHRVDTWDYFDKATGKRLRRERDTTNDGKVDQWWTWDGDRISIAVDRNGDGQPDPSGAIVLDAKTGEPVKESKPAPAASAPPAGSAAPAGAAPASSTAPAASAAPAGPVSAAPAAPAAPAPSASTAPAASAPSAPAAPAPSTAPAAPAPSAPPSPPPAASGDKK